MGPITGDHEHERLVGQFLRDVEEDFEALLRAEVAGVSGDTKFGTDLVPGAEGTRLGKIAGRRNRDAIREVDDLFGRHAFFLVDVEHAAADATHPRGLGVGESLQLIEKIREKAWLEHAERHGRVRLKILHMKNKRRAFELREEPREKPESERRGRDNGHVEFFHLQYFQERRGRGTNPRG